MKDKIFLQWLYDRLHHVHKEPLSIDYMRKLRAIIEAMPTKQESRTKIKLN